MITWFLQASDCRFCIQAGKWHMCDINKKVQVPNEHLTINCSHVHTLCACMHICSFSTDSCDVWGCSIICSLQKSQDQQWHHHQNKHMLRSGLRLWGRDGILRAHAAKQYAYNVVMDRMCSHTGHQSMHPGPPTVALVMPCAVLL